MAKRDILKEAIADAKTVKDTAIANAKAALEEAFTPQLKSMLAAKLEEMELEEEKEEVEEMSDPVMRHGLKGDDKEEIETEKMREEKEDMDEEINLDEILAELEGELNEEENINEDARTDAEEEGYEDGMKDEKEDMEDEEIDLEDMTDEDLKGFIEDVIADMVSSGELEAGENFEEEDVEVEDEVDVDVDSEEEVEINEDMKDEDIEEQFGTKFGTTYSKNNPYDTGEKSLAGDFMKFIKGLGQQIKDLPPAVAKKVMDLKKELGNLEPASPMQAKLRKAGTGKAQKFQSRFESLKREVELVLELQEAQSEIKTLKSTVEVKNEALNEVNLLNAKLLYTNKIFRAKTLTESQKVKVLGAFDKAGTVKETKLVFETLNEGLKTKKTSIRESLGSASKSTGNFKSTKKPIVETDPMVARFQKLAGIK